MNKSVTFYIYIRINGMIKLIKYVVTITAFTVLWVVWFITFSVVTLFDFLWNGVEEDDDSDFGNYLY